MTNKLLLGVLLFGLSSMCFAESDEGAEEYGKSEGMASLGIGSGAFGPTIYGSFAYTVDHHRFAVRYWKADEYAFFPYSGNPYEPEMTCKEFGLLYGRTLREGSRELSGSIGVAYVDGIERGALIQNHAYERVRISTIGLPFEARFRFGIGPLGIAAAWYGNVNSRRSSSGAMLEVSLKVFEH